MAFFNILPKWIIALLFTAGCSCGFEKQEIAVSWRSYDFSWPSYAKTVSCRVRAPHSVLVDALSTKIEGIFQDLYPNVRMVSSAPDLLFLLEIGPLREKEVWHSVETIHFEGNLAHRRQSQSLEVKKIEVSFPLRIALKDPLIEETIVERSITMTESLPFCARQAIMLSIVSMVERKVARLLGPSQCSRDVFFFRNALDSEELKEAVSRGDLEKAISRLSSRIEFAFFLRQKRLLTSGEIRDLAADYHARGTLLGLLGRTKCAERDLRCFDYCKAVLFDS